MKKYSRLSSAAVVTGDLRVKIAMDSTAEPLPQEKVPLAKTHFLIYGHQEQVILIGVCLYQSQFQPYSIMFFFDIKSTENTSIPDKSQYSRTSVARTPVAHFLRLFQTLLESLGIAADMG